MKLYFLLFILFLTSCIDYNSFVNEHLDITPPVLKSVNVKDENTLQIECNERVTLSLESFSSKDSIIKTVVENDNSIEIIFFEELEPGKEYISEFRIEDSNRNSLSFTSKYYGYNSNIPKVILNEFTNKGSKTNPDKLELYVLSSGNTAGMTIYNGTKNSYDGKFIFPSINVNKGEYIVIRSISERYPVGYIEINNINYNNDSKFINGVRDLRIPDLGISTTNGVVTIYDNPFGDVMDCVVFTKNNDNPEKRNRNFGLSKTLERVDELGTLGVWNSKSGVIFPSDAINIDDSTSTRSVNRINFIDSNSNLDWNIVDTGEYSFGYKNSEIYY